MVDIKKDSRTILLASGHSVLSKLIRRAFPRDRILVGGGPKSKKEPDLIFTKCDFRCRMIDCLKKSFYSLQFPKTSFIKARPICEPETNGLNLGYWLSCMNASVPDEKYNHLFFNRIPNVHPFTKILDLQKIIIEGRGKFVRVSEVVKESDLSHSALVVKFMEMTGRTIKSFQSKITMFHAFHDLIFTDLSIKEISINYQMVPNAFSWEFHQRYKITPSQLRKMRNEEFGFDIPMELL